MCLNATIILVFFLNFILVGKATMEHCANQLYIQVSLQVIAQRLFCGQLNLCRQLSVYWIIGSSAFEAR